MTKYCHCKGIKRCKKPIKPSNSYKFRDFKPLGNLFTRFSDRYHKSYNKLPSRI